MGNPQTTISATKIMSVFFPLKPLKNKFSDNFIATQIADFIPKLAQYSDKAIIYKIDKERFYTYDYKLKAFDEKSELVDNATIVVIFSIDKSKNVDFSEMFDESFFKSVNTIRMHRKRIDVIGSEKPSYIFYTINSTKLLNNVISIIQKPNSDIENQTKTFFVLSANNAKREINPLEKSFSTEKICRMNYIFTIELDRAQNEKFFKTLKIRIGSKIKS